ncbi:acyl-ACP--UDP-N-acetylglucosamine O-acyltransferase [candidate division WOR-3 bacterium]|nr:acyl-ACP--UDP-N-acetylglucosamine O-acyltransferase [candidate division WOR-3 bacterium]
MIHSTAIVNPGAILGKNVKIGPYCIINERVKIGNGTELGPYIHIKSKTSIGKECKLYEGVSIGNPPQDIQFKNGKTEVKIGDRNIIREFVTIHGGSSTGTIIGDDNFLMAYVHIAHNCKLGNKIIIANATQVAGYVEIEDYAFVSGLCPVHQFIRIGCYSMIGGGYRVPRDVIPYALAVSDPLRIKGLNLIGLKRQGFAKTTIKTLQEAFDILLTRDLNTSQALEEIKKELPQIPEIKHLLKFIEASKRGIAK